MISQSNIERSIRTYNFFEILLVLWVLKGFSEMWGKVIIQLSDGSSLSSLGGVVVGRAKQVHTRGRLVIQCFKVNPKLVQEHKHPRCMFNLHIFTS